MYLSTLMEPDVLKSALVYFLASLASFIEPINDNLGNVSYLMVIQMNSFKLYTLNIYIDM